MLIVTRYRVAYGKTVLTVTRYMVVHVYPNGKHSRVPHTKRSRYPECVRALRVSRCPCLMSTPAGVCGHHSELEGARAPLYRDSGVLWGIPLHADEPVGGT